MALEIEKAQDIGFCFGVRRAIELLENAVAGYGRIQTLGAVVHNEQVLQKLAKIGITVVRSIDEIEGNVVAISSHGISPRVEAAIRERRITIVDTTCPFVRRAQIAARRLADSGFYVIVYGDAQHPEVKGILGWAGDTGLATLDKSVSVEHLPKRLGVLSQTTQIPEHFTEFAKNIIESALTRDAEIRIIDTICHDIRKRQAVSVELAHKTDLMLVVGGCSSANTRRLAELCSTVARTYHIETAEQIDPSWLKGVCRVGVTSGTSTAEETIDEVLVKLKGVSDKK